MIIVILSVLQPAYDPIPSSPFLQRAQRTPLRLAFVGGHCFTPASRAHPRALLVTSHAHIYTPPRHFRQAGRESLVHNAQGSVSSAFPPGIIIVIIGLPPRLAAAAPQGKGKASSRRGEQEEETPSNISSSPSSTPFSFSCDKHKTKGINHDGHT